MMNFSTLLLLVLLAPISEDDLYKNPDRIEITHQDRTLLTILPNESYWQEQGIDPSEIQMSLAYRHLSTEWKMAVRPAPWKWVAEVGAQSLLVFETSGDNPAKWSLRQFIWKDDKLKEIPPINGSGEVFYFRDFNGDGALEFATVADLEKVVRNSDGLPKSPHVYYFDGRRYRPVVAP